MYHTPIGQLIVPNQVMASQHLSVRLGEIHNRIALVEGESALRRLGRAPLYIALAMRHKLPGRTGQTFIELPGVIWPKLSVLLSFLTYGSSSK